MYHKPALFNILILLTKTQIRQYAMNQYDNVYITHVLYSTKWIRMIKYFHYSHIRQHKINPKDIRITFLIYNTVHNESEWLNTYITHVFIQKVLQRLSHSITFIYDSLPSVVSCAWGVCHKCSSANNAFQPFFKRRPHLTFVKLWWVHYHFLL